jgi:flagellar basal-body rod protein FlgB
MRLFDRTLQSLEASLDARLLRQNVLASNAANIDTPGYQPKEVDFTAAMQEAREQLEAREGGHPVPEARLTAGRAIVDATNGPAGIDGNRVDLDRTMSSLAENAIQYQAATRAAQKKLAILKYVASDGAS